MKPAIIKRAAILVVACCLELQPWPPSGNLDKHQQQLLLLMLQQQSAKKAKFLFYNKPYSSFPDFSRARAAVKGEPKKLWHVVRWKAIHYRKLVLLLLQASLIIAHALHYYDQKLSNLTKKRDKRECREERNLAGATTYSWWSNAVVVSRRPVHISHLAYVFQASIFLSLSGALLSWYMSGWRAGS